MSSTAFLKAEEVYQNRVGASSGSVLSDLSAKKVNTVVTKVNDMVSIVLLDSLPGLSEIKLDEIEDIIGLETVHENTDCFGRSLDNVELKPYNQNALDDEDDDGYEGDDDEEEDDEGL